jgi:hypothetical protein
VNTVMYHDQYTPPPGYGGCFTPVWVNGVWTAVLHCTAKDNHEYSAKFWTGMRWEPLQHEPVIIDDDQMHALHALVNVIVPELIETYS